MKPVTLIISILITLIVGFAALVLIAMFMGGNGEEPYYYEDNGSGYHAEAHQTAPATQAAAIHGLLSYIEYGDNRAYIFGSMHVGRPDMFPLAPVVMSAMERADVFAFEFDFNEEFSFEGIITIFELMMLPEGETLETYLPPEAYAHLLHILSTFDEFDMSEMEEIGAFRPAVIDLTLALLIDEIVGVDSMYSVDDFVFDFANGLGRPVLGLATMEHQMSLLLAPPFDVEVAVVMSMTDQDTLANETRRLTEAYIYQDMVALRRMVNAPVDRSNPAEVYMADVMMRQRTGEFSAEIDRLLRETEEPTTFFITIGIAHLMHDLGNAFYNLENMGHTINELWR